MNSLALFQGINKTLKKHGSLAVVVGQVFSIKLEEAFKRNDVCRRLQYRYIFYSKLRNCVAFQLDRSLTI
jgi:hypothetical protein